MSLPRGHSNIYTEGIKPWQECPDKACIPISGGASVYIVKPLPPLALSRCEWEMIGEAMGWRRKPKPRKVGQ